MKKSNLKTGIYYVIFGSILLLMALLAKGKLVNLLFGFSSAHIIPGILMIGKYFYWNMPKNKKRYEEKLAKETIELHDEMKIMLRDKSGRYAYILGLITISIAIVVFAILGALNVFDSHFMLLFLGGYLVFQYVSGILFFKHLVKNFSK